MSIYYIFPKRGFVAPANSSQPGGPAPSNEQVTWALDVMVSETPTFEAQLTESVVETGGNINDHLTQRPLRLEVEGIISDTPLVSLTPFATASAALGSITGPSRSQAAYSYVKGLYQSKALFDFVGGFQVYQNMMITSFKPVRRAETGGALSFTCTMEQVVFVSTSTLFTPTKKALQQPTSHGQQPLAPVPPSQAAYVSDVVNQGSPVAPVSEETAHTLTPIGSLNLTGVPQLPANSTTIFAGQP